MSIFTISRPHHHVNIWISELITPMLKRVNVAGSDAYIRSNADAGSVCCGSNAERLTESTCCKDSMESENASANSSLTATSLSATLRKLHRFRSYRATVVQNAASPSVQMLIS